LPESEAKNRSRSRSQVPRIRRNPTARFNSADNPRGGGGRESQAEVDQRNIAFVDCSADQLEEMESDVWRLPSEVARVCTAIEDLASEEEKARETSLERGVHNLVVPVNEEDVGSIISYALLHNKVQEAMEAQWAPITGGRPFCPCAARGGSGCDCFFSLPACLRTDGFRASSSWNRAGQSFISTDMTPGLSASIVSGLPASSAAGHHDPHSVWGKLASSPWKRLPGHGLGDGLHGRQPWEDEWEQLGVRNVLTAATPNPVKLEFRDTTANYSVSIHHAPQFHIVRHWLCGDDLNFVRSLHRCSPIKTSGGKSGATFFVSDDRRFLLKAVGRAEARLLTTQAEALFWYADQVLFDKLPSVLAQVFGVFTVSVKWRHKSKQFKRTFIVQRNLRYNLWSIPHTTFDLKGVGKQRRLPMGAVPEDRAVDDEENFGNGSLGPRDSSATVRLINNDSSASADVDSPAPPDAKKDIVFWDQNFREWTEGKPLALAPRDLKYLEAAVWNDTLLLSGQSLVDYSLLLAAAPPPPESLDASSHTSSVSPYGTLAVGIIDYLRPYTWDKQMETVVKSLAHHGTTGQPTVIEPSDYSRRFRTAMGTFFVAEAR